MLEHQFIYLCRIPSDSGTLLFFIESLSLLTIEKSEESMVSSTLKPSTSMAYAGISACKIRSVCLALSEQEPRFFDSLVYD